MTVDGQSAKSGISISTPVPIPAIEPLAGYLPWLARLRPASPTTSFVLYVAANLFAFVAFDSLLERAGSLPAEAYERPLLLVEVLRRLGWGVSAALVLGAFCLLRYGAGWSRWRELQFGKELRVFVVFISVLAAWPFVTHGYNYYFDQGYYVDRALIVMLLPLIWWRPVFVLPFLIMVYAVMGQLTEPTLGGSVLVHKLQLFRAIGLFGAAFVIHALTGQRRTEQFVFLLCCFVAAAYWLPALAKLSMDWIALNSLHTIPLAAYAHGWLGNLSPERLVAYAEWLVPLDLFMRIIVIVVEAACLLLLLHRRVTIFLLSAVIVFHLGVFALLGYFFWTWIALDAALLILLMRGIRNSREGAHFGVFLAISVALILASPWWAKPPWLGWYDTSLSYVYRIKAVTSDGETHRLHPRFFAPYEELLTMTSFGYLVQEHATIVTTSGATQDPEVNNRLAAAKSANDVFDIERSAEISYDEEHAASFYRFLEQFVRTRNMRGDVASALYALRPPPQFWVRIDGLEKLGDRQIRQLIVNEVTTFFDGKNLSVIREIELARLSIPVETAHR